MIKNKIVPIVYCLVLCFVFCASATATDRFYPNITSLSVSGKYKLTAVSPDNEGEGHKAFQADFTYTLVDTTTGNTVWTRKQAMSEAKGTESDPANTDTRKGDAANSVRHGKF